MAGWLSKATSLFQPPPPPVDPFEVECDCGGRVVGLRTATYQKRPCPRCQRPVFVLPSNPYPHPKPKVAQAPIGASGKSTAKANLTPPRTTVDPGPSPAISKSGKRPTPESPRSSQAVAAGDSILVPEPKRLFTSLRLLGISIFAMAALTAVAFWHRYQVDVAKATVTKATDAGEAALREGDFIVAAREYGRARAAVDVLGRNDRAAGDIRRMSLQTNAAAKLASSTLTEILEDSLSRKNSGQTTSIQLTSVDQGVWVIFDTRILPSDDSKDRFEIDAPMQFDETTIQIELETEIFRQLPQGDPDSGGPRVIFAAQLDELTGPKGDPPMAKLILNGKTAFLWSNYQMYVSIGYRPPDPESEQQTRALLDRQLEVQQ